MPENTNRTVGFAQAYLRENTYAGYFQDDWRVTSTLTVNFGVRYEYFAPFTDARNQLLNLDYSTLPQAPRMTTVSSAGQPDHTNFAPRAGLAWTPPISFWPGRKMVFRAGYGIYFAPEIATEAYNLALNNLRTENNITSGAAPQLTIANGFPETASTGFATLYGLDQRSPTPYMQQWNASIQQELPAGILFEIAYIGSKGTDLGLFAGSIRRLTSRRARICRLAPATSSRCAPSLRSAPLSRCSTSGTHPTIPYSSKPRSAWVRVFRF